MRKINKLYSALLIISFFVVLSCEKEPKSVFGHAHRSFKNIVELSSEITTINDVQENFEKMKSHILEFNKSVKQIGKMNLSEIDAVSKKYKEETTSFYNYLNTIMDQTKSSFIQDMNRIGKLNLPNKGLGQVLRNGFFEVLYQLRLSMMKRLRENSSQNNNPSNNR